jgi:uncharacterized protein YbjT (DUF2867 family)
MQQKGRQKVFSKAIPRLYIKMKIAVFGGSGNVGSKLVDRLLESDASVRVICRHARPSNAFTESLKTLSRAPLTKCALEVMTGDMLDPDAVRKALQGIDKVYLLTPVHYSEFAQGMTVFNICKQVGIQHLVYQSVISPETFTDVPHFASKLAMETAIRSFSHNMPYTILRPAYFMQNDLAFVDEMKQTGVYNNTLDDLSILQVDTHDVADVAAKILLTPGTEHYGKTYTIHHPNRLSGHQIASIWSNILDQNVSYGDRDLDTWEKNMRERGAPTWLIFDLRIMYDALHERGVPENPKDCERVESILRRKLHSYEHFAIAITQENG